MRDTLFDQGFDDEPVNQKRKRLGASSFCVAVSAIVALLVALPLVRKGWLLLLDFSFAPKMHVQWVATNASPGPVNAAPFSVLLWTLSKINIFPAFLFVFTLFFGCGFLMGRLVRKLFPHSSATTQLVVGIFYSVNPFTYTRLVHGQVGTQVGMLFWVVTALCLTRLLNVGSLQNAAIFGLAIAGLGFVSVHAFYMLVLVLPAMFVVIGWPGMRNTLVAGGTALAASAFWIVQLFVIRPGSPSAADLSAFTTKPVGYHSLASVASTYGFWRLGEFPLPKDQLPYWYIFFAPIVALIVVGAVLWWRRSKPKAVALLAMIVLSAFIACGVSFPLTAGAFRFLFDHVPGFAIFREPQKWVAVVIFGYCVLLALGVDWLTKVLASRPKRFRIYPETFAALLIGLVLLNAKPMLLSSALKPVEFPKDWYTVDRMMRAEPARALIFPWHLYLDLPFVPHRISNPASSFFSVPVLSSDSIEVGAIRTESTNPESRTVEDVLFNPNGHQRLPEALARLCIHWVVLEKGADWTSYGFLGETSALKRVFDGPTLSLYRAPVSGCGPRSSG